MRIALGIEYLGTAYHGWQRQPVRVSVQSTLEIALSKVANEDIKLICAGRTDSGVHALSQVAYFDTQANRRDRDWILGCNTALPHDISLIWTRQVDEEFHARFSAVARQYRFIIFNSLSRPAILQDRVWWVHEKLDEKKMHQAAQALVGKHDFNAYRAKECQSHSSVRQMEYIKVHRDLNFIYIDIKGNAFLHHMVRNIVGSLYRVGQGLEQIDWMREVLMSKNRALAGITSPATGLYLVGAYYPENFQIPEPVLPIHFSYR